MSLKLKKEKKKMGGAACHKVPQSGVAKDWLKGEEEAVFSLDGKK